MNFTAAYFDHGGLYCCGCQPEGGWFEGVGPETAQIEEMEALWSSIDATVG